MADCTCADPSAVSSAINSQTSTLSDTIDESGVSLRRVITDKDDQNLDQTFYGLSLGGKHGTLGPLRFCHWAAPEVSGTMQVVIAGLYKGAAAAIALANANNQAQIFAMKQEVAEDWYNHANQKWERFNGTYLPKEQDLSYEILGYQKKELNCADAMSRANAATTTAFSSCSDIVNRKAKALNMCIDDGLARRFEQHKAQTLVDCTNYNLRDDTWWKEVYNDSMWDRRSVFIDLGRNLPSMALTYGRIGDRMMSHYGSQVTTIAGDMVQTLGYFGSRLETSMPNTFLGANIMGGETSAPSLGSMQNGGMG